MEFDEDFYTIDIPHYMVWGYRHMAVLENAGLNDDHLFSLIQHVRNGLKHFQTHDASMSRDLPWVEYVKPDIRTLDITKNPAAQYHKTNLLNMNINGLWSRGFIVAAPVRLQRSLVLEAKEFVLDLLWEKVWREKRELLMD